MALAQKEKELVAIGASIGAGCRPCIDHHIDAGTKPDSPSTNWHARSR
jgi:AhpD family alkylhydroperoxidase